MSIRKELDEKVNKILRFEHESRLIKGPCEVKFTKADGTERTMLCTLKDEYIMKESAGESVKRPETQVVWDIEKEDWRSYRYDRVKSIDGPLI